MNHLFKQPAEDLAQSIVRANNPFLVPVLMAVIGVILAGRVTAQPFTTLHNFTENSPFGISYINSDGGGPQTLIMSGDTLYGTALGYGLGGNGTVFKVDTDGSGFTVLHTFSYGLKNSDGAYSWDRLILSSNTLYGTGYFCGSSGNGTVFKLNANAANSRPWGCAKGRGGGESNPH